MQKKTPLLLACLGAALVTLVYAGGLFSGFENFLEDRLFSSKEIDSRIVILAIDNESISKIGQWPWPRKVFSDVLLKLEAEKPAAVGVDVVFADASRLGSGDDLALEKTLEDISYPVIFPIEGSPIRAVSKEQYEADVLVSPLPQFLSKVTALGHVNLLLDGDSVARRFPSSVVARTTRTEYHALSIETVRQSKAVGDFKNLPSTPRIVYAGQPGAVRRISFSRILSDTDIPDLTGKIVFIGVTSPDLHDEQATPFSRGAKMPGVEIQANIANMLLRGYRLTSLPQAATVAWIWLSAFAVFMFFRVFERSTKPLLGSLFLGARGGIAVILLFDSGVSANFIVVQLAWLLPAGFLFLYRYFSTERERRELKHAFSKYVSKDVLDEMMRNPEKIKLGGEEKEATVFFSDVRGFTTLSEKMTPTQLTHFLNKYLTIMTDITLERRGVVDKYIGDAIMAFWGAPLSNPSHPIDAIETSMEMTEALERFNTESSKEGDPAIDIGIGLNSGRVTAGNMGSEKRFDYTVMGDTVNLASRLESLTKLYGVHIIISQFTYALLDQNELLKKGILIREIDRVKVKGKKLPVTIYEVVDKKKQERVRGFVEQFNEARAHYYRGDWGAALIEFRRILELEPQDGPTILLHERCLYFTENPPDSWDGSYEMKSK